MKNLLLMMLKPFDVIDADPFDFDDEEVLKNYDNERDVMHDDYESSGEPGL